MGTRQDFESVIDTFQNKTAGADISKSVIEKSSTYVFLLLRKKSLVFKVRNGVRFVVWAPFLQKSFFRIYNVRK